MDFQRKLHDSNSAVRNVLQGQVKPITEHTRIKTSFKLFDELTDAWKNPFSDRINSHIFSLNLEQPAGRCYHLKDVYVTGSEGDIFFDTQHFFAICPGYQIINPKKIRRPIKQLAKSVDEPTFHLGGRCPENRGHFMVDHIPRLIAGLKLIKSKGIEKILVPPGHLKWRLPFLLRLGFNEQNIIEGSSGTIRFKELYYIPLLSQNQRFPMAPAHLYLKSKEAFLTDHSSIPKIGDHILITRKNAPDRLLQNEDAIVKMLRGRYVDLKVIEMSDLNFEQQLGLFAHSKLIIGAHGQPFRYLLFGNKLTSIQLTPGAIDENNKFQLWSYLYDFLGNLTDNKCVTLASGQAYLNDSNNWSYPLEKLEAELEKIAS